MSTYLTFSSHSDADLAQNKIWCNFLLANSNNTERLVGDGGGNDYFLSDIQSMTDTDLCVLKLYGKIQGLIQDAQGFTTAWANPHNCYNNSNKWVFIKPDNSLMTGVVNYTEEEEDPNWWPPLDA